VTDRLAILVAVVLVSIVHIAFLADVAVEQHGLPPFLAASELSNLDSCHAVERVLFL